MVFGSFVLQFFLGVNVLCMFFIYCVLVLCLFLSFILSILIVMFSFHFHGYSLFIVLCV
ncbi:unnamed protein product, partial [Schistosoma haematobium]